MAAPKFVQRILGVYTSVSAAVVSAANSIVATNAFGTIDPSFFPAGYNADVVVLPASEALAPGALVNIWSNAGVASARNADSATAGAVKKCMGFVQSAVANGAQASVYRSGMNTGLTGLTPGVDYYLGATGAATQTVPPETPGTTAQLIGTATQGGVLDVQPGLAVAIGN